ncbi:hypothetical protein P171DRAFT_436201 [Karstenula rhodostoma CBS 690.94]|uniref:Uncharacterized protein n=1 Tax=Karstenula rhodostoma CBS 690.94 TaxID=1392251 RepID=A0A9P4U789_9PLEO|nr:hypothetical protein P171DRAFT_436201 [Karstenula rhodostoma CBS 690.94]
MGRCVPSVVSYVLAPSSSFIVQLRMAVADVQTNYSPTGETYGAAGVLSALCLPTSYMTHRWRRQLSRSSFS